MTSSPLWPGAPGSGKPGIAEYGIRLADCTASAIAPSPEPKTIATRGRKLPSRSATASAARRISSEPAAPIPQSAFRIPHSQQDPRERRRQEVRQRPRDHGPEPESREVVLALRHQRADAPDLDPDRADVREAAQRERGDGEGHGIELSPERPQLRVGDELDPVSFTIATF